MVDESTPKITQIQVSNVTYNIADASARESLASFKTVYCISSDAVPGSTDSGLTAGHSHHCVWKKSFAEVTAAANDANLTDYTFLGYTGWNTTDNHLVFVTLNNAAGGAVVYCGSTHLTKNCYPTAQQLYYKLP